MTWYWLLLLWPTWWAISTHSGAFRAPARISQGAWLAAGLVLALSIGLRHEVGGDWFNYQANLVGLNGIPFIEAIRIGDPAFTALGWLAGFWGGDHLVNALSAVPFTIGLLVFCRAQPQPWLALAVAIPYLVIVVAMGYTRQGVAIGFALLGVVALNEGRWRTFLMWIAIAALFHKSAVILMPLALFSGTRNRLLMVLGVVLAGGLAFVLLLQEAIENLLINYVGAEMESTGAAIRVAMNALPAALFLALRSKFQLALAQQRFWTWMALSALLFVPALGVSPSSTAVDRVALYWIPIQLFVWSRLPLALSPSGLATRRYTALILLYCAAVQAVWLLFATHSYAWLPYRFLPLEWLKNML
jgi:hypothetical protein